MVSSAADYPTLERIRATADRLSDRILRTPVWQWQTDSIRSAFSPQTQIWLKLELFQHTGTFKARGALNNVDNLTEAEKSRGVVGVSGGNHAIALAYAAQRADITAKVVMPEYASPLRIETCRELGAEVVLVPDVHKAFECCQEIVDTEARTLVHPFEGERTVEGTAMVGLELMEQVPALDAVVVPVGGGGLIAGIAAAVKQINPDCAVYGVEPYGADSLYQSRAAGEPVSLDKVDTIADSLGAPLSMPYSFGVCQRFVDDVVRVSDDDLCAAMWRLYQDVKLATEPATGAATAALLGPLKERLDGRNVALVMCGANLDPARFEQLLQRGRSLCNGGGKTA